MANERITSKMSVRDAVMAMGGGNPGAINVCMELMNQVPTIDPDALLGGVTYLLHLDSHGIYEGRIWLLFKDVCGEDLGKMVAVLRANQLGQLAGVTDEVMNHAIDNGGDGINLDAVMAAVQEQLPNFQPEAAAA